MVRPVTHPTPLIGPTLGPTPLPPMGEAAAAPRPMGDSATFSPEALERLAAEEAAAGG